MTRRRKSQVDTLLPPIDYLPRPGRGRRGTSITRGSKDRGRVSPVSIATTAYRTLRFIYALQSYAGIIAIAACCLLWYSPAVRGYLLSWVLPSSPGDVFEVLKSQF